MGSTRDYDFPEEHVLFGEVPTSMEPGQFDILKLLYTETCSSWRTLTDVRFKLMGFLPVASGAFLLAILASGKPGEGASPCARAGLVVFGLLITAGLWVYDRRNDELYDELMRRGKRIEYELGVQTGLFLGRPRATKGMILLSKKNGKFKRSPLIRHGAATGLIYIAVVGVWVFALWIIWRDLR